MKDNFKSKLGFSLFFFIVFALAIGGYIFLKYERNIDKEKAKEKEKEVVDYRIDKDKDYFYFINESTISNDAEIFYKDVVINLNTQTVLTESLEKENKMYKDNIQYISKQELITNEVVNYNNDDIYALTFRDYKTYKYNNYISLLINDYNYSCFDAVTFKKVNAYTFDINNGNVVTFDELLDIYKMNMDTVKEKVRDYLISKQSADNGVEVIKIDETINELTNYALYINDYGKLAISFLVKTTQVDYNEVMEVN